MRTRQRAPHIIRACVIAASSACALLLAGCQSPSARHAPTRVTFDDVPLGAVRNLSTDGRDFFSGVAEPTGLKVLRDDHGVKTVIDLRLPDQKPADYEQTVRSVGLEYVAVPIHSDALTPEDAEAILEALDEHNEAPMLIQCGSANRAGAAYGLYCALKLNRPIDEALRLAEQAGARNEQLKRDLERYLRARAEDEDDDDLDDNDDDDD
ncbi:MAG: hypothetical protein D6744_12670 [Planctomycetota bacterium]|nr:MAG: hypothetical protein D6744_12670 [Planctomycetota bacterium]